MSTKTLPTVVLALLLGVLFVGCASDLSYKYPESTEATVIEGIPLPANDPDEMSYYVRSVLMAYILKGKYEEAYAWKVPTEGYDESVVKAGEAEREEVLNKELYPRWAAAKLAPVRAKVRPLVADNQFAKAREAVWRLPNTGIKPLDVLLREGRAEILNETVNVKQWKMLEPTLKAKVAEFLKAEQFDEARAYLAKVPRIRTYTILFDKQVQVVCSVLESFGVPADKLEPVKAEASKVISEAFADATEAYEASSYTTTTDGTEVDLEKYNESLKQLHKVLVKYDCDEAKADKIVEAIQKAVQPLIAEYCAGEAGKSETTDTTSLTKLGTTQVNAKIDALVKELTEAIDAAEKAKMLADLEAAMKRADYAKARRLAIALKLADRIAESLIKEVRQYAAAKQWDKARTCIRDYVDIDNAEVDAALYLLRVGLLNCDVNPVQLDDLLAKMADKYTKMVATGELLKAREWLMNYKPVEDAYPDIDKTLATVKKGAETLTVDPATAEARTKAFRASVQAILDARKGSYFDPVDQKAEDAKWLTLDDAVAALVEAIVDQYNNEPEVKARVNALIESFKADVAAQNAAKLRCITTEEMNKALMAKRDELLKTLDVEIVRKEQEMAEKARREAYERLLVALDKEVGINTQISIAEDAIMRGLPMVSQGLHTVLGDYARAFRLLKNKAELTDAQKSAILVGAAYLNQPVVVSWACDLGAVVDAPAARDPLARPAVLVAVQAGNAAVIRALAAAEAKMDVADANGDTMLHYAVRVGDANIIRLALEGTDVNAVNKAGAPAIFIAAARNQLDLVAQLIEAKADMTIANAAGYTVMDIACAAGARDILDALVAADAPISDKALLLAAANDRLACAQWLVARGADVNADGVMDAAKVDTATYAYLVSQGGRPKATNCLTKTLFFPEELAAAEAAEAAARAKDPIARKLEAEAKKAEAEALKAEIEAQKAAGAKPAVAEKVVEEVAEEETL